MLAILPALGFLACSSSQPPNLAGQELHLYSFSAYIPSGILQGYEKATGVRVVHETYASNEDMMVGLASRPGYYDLIIPSDYAIAELIATDGLQPLDLARIPSWNHIDPRFLSPYFDPGGATRGRRPSTSANAKYSIPFQWGTTGIAFDRSKVDPPLQAWADLWRPDLQGQVVVLDDSREMLGLTLLALGYDKNDTNGARLEEAREKLRPLVTSALAVDSATPEDKLVTGEARAAVVYNGNAVLAARRNPSIEYVFPTEGAGIWFDNMAIPTGAPHPDAAHAFIEYVLQPQASVLITREFPFSNPNQEALDWLRQQDMEAWNTYQADPATNPSPDVLGSARPVKRVTAEAARAYETAWNDLLSGRKERP